MSIDAVTRRSASNPGDSVCAAMKLRRNNVAPTSNTRHTATCATTSAFRSRPVVRPPLPLRPSSFKALIVCGLEACSAGASPKITPVTTDTPTANINVTLSIRKPRSIGMSTGGTNAMITSIVQYAITTPAVPATKASSNDSVSNWRTRRMRLAPSDRRTATSRRRLTAFDNNRFATFAQAITSTRRRGSTAPRESASAPWPRRTAPPTSGRCAGGVLR